MTRNGKKLTKQTMDNYWLALRDELGYVPGFPPKPKKASEIERQIEEMEDDAGGLAGIALEIANGTP
jgi:hypothetical protein